PSAGRRPPRALDPVPVGRATPRAYRRGPHLAGDWPHRPRTRRGARPAAEGGAADPPGWTVAAVGGAPEVEDGLTRAVADRPDVTVRTLAADEAEAHRLCPAPGYHLIRPDGYVAAHGHGADRVRLRAELTAHLGAPAKDPLVAG
ncbi:hypothetical protein ACIBFB_27070, partial [Nocardiopsis sp. NPDC050513]